MKKQESVAESPQGGDEANRKTLTAADIKRMVERDLPTCIKFLESLYHPDVVDQVVTVLHGQYMNHKHKQELEAQLEIKP